MADIIAGSASALTPNRGTTATFDITEEVLIEEPWGAIRMFGEVAPLAASTKGADGRYSTQMHFWSCGCWTLRPVQFDFDHLEKDLPWLIYTITP